MRLLSAALIVVVFALLLAACDEPPVASSPSPAPTAGTSAPTAGVPLVPSATPTPSEQLALREVFVDIPGKIEVTPSTGSCELPRRIVGSGFEPNVTVTIERPEQGSPSRYFTESLTDDSGSFAARLPPLPECAPGREYRFLARTPVTSFPSYIAVRLRQPGTAFMVDPPGPLALEPAAGCGGPALVTGSGFPPLATVELSVFPSFDQRVVLAPTTADDAGNVRALLEIPQSSICGPRPPQLVGGPASVRVVATVQGVRGRWVTTYTFAP